MFYLSFIQHDNTMKLDTVVIPTFDRDSDIFNDILQLLKPLERYFKESYKKTRKMFAILFLSQDNNHVRLACGLGILV